MTPNIANPLHLMMAIAMISGLIFGNGQALAASSLPVFSTDDDRDDRARAVACLATAIVYEAGHEPLAGQQAVAEVVMNRLRNPAFPKTVCGVIFQGSQRRTGCQFTFSCDGSLKKTLSATLFARARVVAESAIEGLRTPSLLGATHYHASSILPYWAPSLVKLASIGNHIFYRLPGATDLQPPLRYVPTNEQLPSLNVTRQDISGTQASRRLAPPRTSVAQAPFMPWGLVPISQPPSIPYDLPDSNE